MWAVCGVAEVRFVMDYISPSNMGRAMVTI